MTQAKRRINKVLVANRGEIARRVQRTCRAMGIDTVAVFSDADAEMPFVHEADEAVRIGPAPSAESYLAVDKIVAAALQTGADAIHPGYGFLAENAAFARAVEEAGLVFIGPPADVIAKMGDKRAAKALAVEAGVPVVPGYDGRDQDPAVLAAEARTMGFPVLLKASAGGGGKGMKRVDADAGLLDAIASAKREAKGAFGDDTLLVERYVERPRHIEVQIFGDAHGHVAHVFERECSIQRRHQKIVEETPSPGIDDALRGRICAAAVRLGRAIGYQNAGTVEFVVAQDGSFYFLEVNTRLQVEHPVTELVSGLDLVREQIRVAEGAPLSFTQAQLVSRGAAIEVRLYAEDPASGFLPQSGRVVDFAWDARDGLRVDAGVEAGSEVGIHYDPMLAKVIAHGPTRSEAVAKLRRGLRDMSVAGLVTNRELLIGVLGHAAFERGETDTAFLDRWWPDAADRRALCAPGGASNEPEDALLAEAAIAAALADHERRRAARALLAHVPSGFRNNFMMPQRVAYRALRATSGEPVVDVRYRALDAGGFEVRAGGFEGRAQVIACEPPGLTLELGLARSPDTDADGDAPAPPRAG